MKFGQPKDINDLRFIYKWVGHYGQKVLMSFKIGILKTKYNNQLNLLISGQEFWIEKINGQIYLQDF